MSESVWLKLRDNPSARLGAALLTMYLLAALLAGVLAPYGFDDQDFGRQYQAPSSSHLLGTDDLGRDQFSRVLYGARISLTDRGFCGLDFAVRGGTDRGPGGLLLRLGGPTAVSDAG